MFAPSKLLRSVILILCLTSPTIIYADTHPVLNEFLAHPSSGPDWVEIYNPTSTDIDLNGWSLFDSSSSMKTLSGHLLSGGFISFDLSNRLNNTGDAIYLKDLSGGIIDSYIYSLDPGIDISIGRSPDGGDWMTLSAPSKNSPNTPSQFTPTSIQITATNTPYNPSSTPSPPTPTSIPTLPLPSPSFLPTATPTPLPNWIINLSNNILDATQTLSASISLNNLQASSIYYLKAAFQKSGSANYFGKTYVSDIWIKNNQTYNLQLPILTDNQGSWQGNLKLMADIDDSGFVGSGDYLLKIGRYTQTGSGPIWSDPIIITINYLPPSPTSIIVTFTPTPTLTITLAPTYSTHLNLLDNFSLASPSGFTSYLLASPSASPINQTTILGISTRSAALSYSKPLAKPLNLLIIAGLVFILSGLSFLPHILRQYPLYSVIVKMRGIKDEILHQLFHRD